MTTAHRTRTALLLMGCLLALVSSSTRAEETTDLAGPWEFAIDPAGKGETTGWHHIDEGWDNQKPAPVRGWDAVTVPHCWSVDPRYEHTGKAWYRRSVNVPASSAGTRYRIEFDAVFYKARVWLNGRLVGEHEGGYTPFSFDITPHVRADRYNLVVVEVDNGWSTETLPGARPGQAAADQVYPWWNYGGINRPARIVAHPSLHITGQKVIATPDPATGTATLEVAVQLRNDGDHAAEVQLDTTLTKTDGGQIRVPSSDVIKLAAGEAKSIAINTTLAAQDVQLWEIGHPSLYSASIRARTTDAAGSQTTSDATVRFGIRSIKTADGKLLVNGRPVRLAGANRVMDHPTFGATEPDELVNADLQQMKDAHLVLARLQHYPVASNLLDWADENGMLLIAEVPAWQLKSAQLADPVIQAKFRAQMGEMIASSRNHPSVIGWSVGNEYESWTPEGVAWTREMSAFVRTQDPTRPVVFAAIGTQCSKLLDALHAGPVASETNSFHYSDILCLNVYVAPEQVASWLDAVHKQWPDKPILISEYGMRADRVKEEVDRITHFTQMLDLVRSRDFVCGLAYWSFNDYRSRYPGSGADGYRRWGLVDERRQPRGLLKAMRDAFASVTIHATRQADSIEIELASRIDFPSLTLATSKLRIVTTDGTVLVEQKFHDLRPGEHQRATLKLPAGVQAPAVLEAALVDDVGQCIATTSVR